MARMESGLSLMGSVVAAFLSGAVAFAAPCCAPVMLPAYLAASFPRRGVRVAMTFVFAAGVATVVLPLALGASYLRQLLFGYHAPVYVAMGLAMLGMGLYTLAGRSLHLPVPTLRAGASAGPWGIYVLGVVSGVTSACCAPVLAGALALAATAPSFVRALGLGAAYEFGMMAPLFALALLWERYGRESGLLSRFLHARGRVPLLRRSLPLPTLTSGILLLAIGAWLIKAGLSPSPMAAPRGWTATAFAAVQAYGIRLARALDGLPGLVAALVLVAIVWALARIALRQLHHVSEEARHHDQGS